MSHVDLECGRRGSGAAASEEEEDSVCFSDGSCNSGFCSTDDCSFCCGSDECTRVSSASDLESDEKRDCRICHLSLVGCNGIAIELGCCCKDDLAAAHQHCAQTWFTIKGNKTCEICNSVARNVAMGAVEGVQQSTENAAAVASSTPVPETQTCLNGHRFLNFLLACMVFAFVVSWLFHFNIPSDPS